MPLYWQQRHEALHAAPVRTASAPMAMVGVGDAAEGTATANEDVHDLACRAELVMSGAEFTALRQRLPEDIFRRVREQLASRAPLAAQPAMLIEGGLGARRDGRTGMFGWRVSPAAVALPGLRPYATRYEDSPGRGSCCPPPLRSVHAKQHSDVSWDAYR